MKIQVVKMKSMLLVILLTALRRVYAECSASDRTALVHLNVTWDPQAFNSPGWPVSYYPSLDCQWLLDSGYDNERLVVDVTAYYIESSPFCLYDGLVVYYGSSTSVINERICDVSSSGRMFVSLGRHMLFRLKSDSSVQMSGFSARYFIARDLSGTGCSSSPQTLTSTNETQFITSPGFPDVYTGGLSCSWMITTSDVSSVVRVEIVFSDIEFDSSCSTDKLTLWDGVTASGTPLAKICEPRERFPSGTSVFFSTGTSMFITFATLSLDTSRIGFKVVYYETDSPNPPSTVGSIPTTIRPYPCHGTAVTLTAAQTPLYMTSVNYPQFYENNLDCYWSIEAPYGYVINLTFVDVHLEETIACGADYVVVYDGSDTVHPVLERLCGTETPVTISSGRSLTVWHHTDGSAAYRGFRARYVAFDQAKPHCLPNNTLELTAGPTPQFIESPGYAEQSDYPNRLDAWWLIYNPNATGTLVIEVEDSHVEASVDCEYDRVIVYNGPCTTYPTIGTFCGADTPTYYQRTGSYALINFETDSTVKYRGFRIKYYSTTEEVSEASVLPVDIIVGVIVGLTLLGVIIAITVVIIYCGEELDEEDKNSRHSSLGRHSSMKSPAMTSSGTPVSMGQRMKKNVRKMQLIHALMPEKYDNEKHGLLKIHDPEIPSPNSDMDGLQPVSDGRESMVASNVQHENGEWPETPPLHKDIPGPYLYVSPAQQRHINKQIEECL